VFLLVGSVPAYAASLARIATVSWESYRSTGMPAETLRLYRGMGAECANRGMWLPSLIATIPISSDAYVDTTIPATLTGMVCYELTAVGRDPTSGVEVESYRSNRAGKPVLSQTDWWRSVIGR
jgi:hypothetical protein